MVHLSHTASASDLARLECELWKTQNGMWNADVLVYDALGMLVVRAGFVVQMGCGIKMCFLYNDLGMFFCARAVRPSTSYEGRVGHCDECSELWCIGGVICRHPHVVDVSVSCD